MSAVKRRVVSFAVRDTSEYPLQPRRKPREGQCQQLADLGQRQLTSIEESKRIPISFQDSQVLPIQFILASRLAYFRVLVDFRDGEADDFRQVNREVYCQLREVS